MKKLAVAVCALAVSTIAASAADMAPRTYTKAPIMVDPAINWTGFYIGVSGGGTWGRAKIVNGVPPATDETNWFDANGGIVGGTVGYNYQAGKFVLGVEGDISWVNNRGSAFDIPPFTTTYQQQIDQIWLATIRGRVGFLVTPALLLYGTAGYAAADVKQTVIAPGGTTLAESHTLSGWTAGAGGEWKFNQNWSLKAEYLYIRFDDKSYFNPAPGILFANDQRVRLHENIGRVGINYTFGGPVVAKY